MRVLRKILQFSLSFILLLLWLWSLAALGIDGGWLYLSAVLVLQVVLVLMIWRKFEKRYWALGLLVAGNFLGVFLWWSTIQPQEDRHWAVEYRELPEVVREGDLITFHKLRNFQYLEDGSPKVEWISKTVDLKKLRSLDLFLDYWGSNLIAHPMFSFGFEDGSRVIFSVETRRETHETFSSVKGFFKQFELIYLVGEESDFLNLRLHERKEQLYWYPLHLDPKLVRERFEDYLERIEILQKRPEFYNAVTSNCTTDMRQHASQTFSWDYRILVNGLMDQMMFEGKVIQGPEGMSFEEYKPTRKIDRKKVDRSAVGLEFSKQIREAVDGRRSES